MFYRQQPRLPPTANEYKKLWSVETVCYFLKLLIGSNPTMLEAACGAIQNLAACDWKVCDREIVDDIFSGQPFGLSYPVKLLTTVRST